MLCPSLQIGIELCGSLLHHRIHMSASAHNTHPLWHIPKAEQELRRLSDLYSQSHTKVPDYLLEKKEELIDRIKVKFDSFVASYITDSLKGILWGNAIGDAIGLATVWINFILNCEDLFSDFLSSLLLGEFY